MRTKSTQARRSKSKSFNVPVLPMFIALAIVAGIITIMQGNALQSKNLMSSSSEASVKQCPIARSYMNGCFTIKQCNRDGFGTGDETSCYRYVLYTCNQGKYEGKNKYLDPISKCWSQGQAAERIAELCGCSDTPSETVLSCNGNYSAAGKKGITTLKLDLGTGTGTVGLKYNAFDNPDRFRVTYNGAERIDTGFRGNANMRDPDYNVLLDEFYPPTDNDPLIVGAGEGYATFQKDSSERTATLRVDAPIGKTVWEVNLTCSGDKIR